MYQPGKRSLQLLKRKDWLDVWCQVVKLYEGKTTELGSKFRNTLGGVSCKMGNASFDVGSGFTNEERNAIWDKKSFIHRVHVRYEKLSEDGIPLKPTVIEWD
jgi:ATP-dependent DNA ligase